MHNSSLKRVISQNTRELGLLAIIVIFAVLVNMRTSGYFLSNKNISDMLVETSVLVLPTLGMMMVIITGGIDLSIGSVMALAGMAGTMLLKNNMELPTIVIIAVAVVTGALAGLVNGFLISRLNILPIIATLGTMNIFRGATYLLSGGSWVLQQNMSTDFMNLATGKLFGINNLIWIAVATALVCHYFLNFSRTGRKIYAVGNSVESAQVSGIKTNNVILLVYTLMGICAALGGILYVCKYAAAQGETATGYEMNAIASCVLGGVSVTGGSGKVHGAVMGAILFSMLNNALPLLQISPFWQEALRGTIILVSIILNVVISRSADKRALERRAMA